MDKWVEHIEKQDASGSVNVMKEQDWLDYKTESEWDTWFKNSNVKPESRESRLKKMKADFLKYGSIYGKKYAVTTKYGKWDSEFTVERLGVFIKHFYRILKMGGTCIIFFDLWKITHLREMLESEKFKQIRLVEWIKTNPQPINSKVNYLTNCREIALLGIKKSKPTFNSKYDKGIYEYPLQGGKQRFHPTQKSLPLFEDLIKKHSNEGDLVLDCFAGSATTAIAAMNTNRRFIGCEMEEEYYNKSLERINEQNNTKNAV
jgi:site-specific DNA-methyltransferase (adenine-specific)